MTTTKKILVSMVILGTTSLFANSAEVLYKACATCHGANGEKPALGKSKVLKGWDSKRVQDALKGYKDGTYGGVMKGVMKGQVTRLSDADIKLLGDYIASFK
ncbi:cytochrome C [Malaciobacter halophilus]|uniref:Cytochrome C n=1 Tax=Malaciobacter halophilus TaxID=197482 RepID=A0A2N1J2H1_9BACT|nr:c-type cytochrome [Malaciobacter halophilus]AXH09929.1 periplasmic monoheme cytochrome c553 [Malaciobacter halophilus]PKI80750.1 cytochrome C [Malaciobacter halophilus]